MNKPLLLLALLGLCALASSAPVEDIVSSLPGLPEKPQFNHYSGYLHVGNTGRQLHYWFFESQRTPSSDPLVLWMNGGPGCSSMLGAVYEHGPWVFPDESTELVVNPFSWNKEANVLYLEAPAGVGFSFSKNTQDYQHHNDNKTAHDNLEALLSFFTKFPEYKGHDFFVSGESYAGIYVPTLAHTIVVHNEQAAEAQRINLKGIMVGNGIGDWKEDAGAFVQFAHEHYLYSETTHQLVQQKCAAGATAECEEAQGKMRAEVGQVNIYDIYRKCYGLEAMKKGNLGASQLKGAYNPLMLPYSKYLAMPRPSSHVAEGMLGAGLTPPCAEAEGALKFFNDPEVRKALHVPTDLPEWGMCSDEINQSYQIDFERGSIYAYYTLLKQKMRILVYSGDTDAAVPITGTVKWISNFGLPVKEAWRAWHVSGQVAGYVVKYDGLDFVSVKGTGHMVPQWKPAEAFHMLKAFLDQTAY